MTLRQNELKLVRHFKIDMIKYNNIRNEEDRFRFLMSQMEEDIKANIETITKSVEQKQFSYSQSQKQIMNSDGLSSPSGDTYKWLKIDTKNKELQPKLKH